MATSWELRKAAGARYVDALTELGEAMIELAALDIVTSVYARYVRTFHGLVDSWHWPFRHPDFAPEAGPDVRELAKARANNLPE